MKKKLMLAIVFLMALVLSSCSDNRSSGCEKAECYYVFNWKPNDSIESLIKIYDDSLLVSEVNGNRGEYKCIMPESQNYWLEREINGFIDTSFTYSCCIYTKKLGDSLKLISETDYLIDSISYPDWSFEEMANIIEINMNGEYEVTVYGTKYLHNGRIIRGTDPETYYFSVRDFVDSLDRK